MCPNEAIRSESPIYIINPDLCTECVGAEDEPQCRTVCPVDCIIDDPDRRETAEELKERYDRLHA
jgi:ferredoxin